MSDFFGFLKMLMPKQSTPAPTRTRIFRGTDQHLARQAYLRVYAAQVRAVPIRERHPELSDVTKLR